jgi:signal transduction histidine kinase/PAS domain-containing protein
VGPRGMTPRSLRVRSFPGGNLQLFATIRGRLYLLALLALAPLLAMFGHAAFAMYRVREESELAANLELARATAAAFSAFVDDVSRTALPLGEAFAAGHMTADEATALLEKTAGAYVAVREFSWASPAGEILASSNPRAVGIDVSDREYQLRILAGDDRAVSDLIASRTGEAGAVFIIARAVRASGGRLLGTMLAVVAPDRLHERTLPITRIGDAALSLVDRSGRVAFRAPATPLSWEEREAVARHEIVRRALRGEEAMGRFAGVSGDERLGAATPVDGIGWVARASRDSREAFGPVRREFARAGIVAIVAAVAFLGASALLGRRIVRALRRLEDHAEALGRGEPSVAPLSDVPEITHLAETYARMAERLRASREAIQTAFESAPAGILLLAGDTLRVRWANRAYLELLEEPHCSGGITGARVEEFLPTAEALGLVHALGRVAGGAVPHSDAEYRFERFAGAARWSRWSMRAIPSSERPNGRDVLVVATDVTEQVTSRRRVEEDRGRLEAVLDALPIGVVIVDAGGKVVEANPAARTIWGGALPEGFSSYRGWWPDTGAPLAPSDWAAARALGRGETTVGEFIDIERTDGGRATILNNAVPIRGAGGAITGAVAAVQDVSELRRAQKRERILLDAGAVLAETLDLEDAARRLARFAVPLVADLCAVDEVLPDGTLRRLAVAHRDPAHDDGGRSGAARPGRSELGSHALVLRAVSERLTVHVPEVSEALRGMSDGPEPLDGLRSWIAVPLVASGTVVGVLTLATVEGGARLGEEDVRLAEELGWRAAQALDNARLFGEVQRAVRSRDEVLSVVSHDLRNPLGVVSLGARLIAELPDDPGALERARTNGRRILTAGDRMARLIGDLLDLTALQEGRLAVERSACAPPDLLRVALEEAKGAAKARGLELRCEAQGGLPHVACDHGRVLQILGNLLSNAIKATGRGRVEISASRGDGEVIFAVADTGPGISAEDQARLFERFRRGANANYQGTGLGLAISRALVEAHGGRIWVESRPGEGATFRFTLPVARWEPARAPGCEDQPGGAPGRGASGAVAAAGGER